MDIKQTSPEALQQFEQQLSEEYQSLQAQNLSLELTRGKPSSEQLDTNIRIAPSFPPEHELVDAMKVLTTCVKLATVRRLLVEKL